MGHFSQHAGFLTRGPVSASLFYRWETKTPREGTADPRSAGLETRRPKYRTCEAKPSTLELEDIAKETSKIPRGTAPATNTHPCTAGAGCRYSTALPAGTPRWAPPRAAAGSPGCSGTWLSFPPCTPCRRQRRFLGLWELHRSELGRRRRGKKNTAKESASNFITGLW